LKEGDIIAGRYQILKKLGTGGMGMVFLAEDSELIGTKVALKILQPHLASDEEVFKRFRNEVLVARSLSHPNIVSTFDMGKTAEGSHYICMEYVEGETLKELVHRNRENPKTPLTLQQSLTILGKILLGLAYAHKKGIVHRDIKPANVLVSPDGEVRLADFGTARIIGLDTSLTKTGQVIGTPDYMSPEQIRGEELDHLCDIYSFGILAFELFTARRPYTGESAVSIAFKHLNEPIPQFFSVQKGIPRWVEDIVRKATSKKKSERFENCNILLQEFYSYEPKLKGWLGLDNHKSQSYQASADDHDDKGWSLGDIADAASFIFPDKKTSNKSHGGLIVGIFGLTALVATILLNDGVRSRIGLSPLDKNLGADENKVDKNIPNKEFANLEVPSPTPVKAIITPTVSLVATPVSITPKPTPEKVVATPTAVATIEKSLTPTPEPTATPTPTPTPTPVPTPTPFDLKAFTKNLTGELVLTKRDGNKVEFTSKEDLRDYSWKLVLKHQEPIDKVAQKILMDDLSISLKANGKEIGLIKPEHTKNENGLVIVDGRLPVDDVIPNSGQIIITANINGELVGSTSFAVYSANTKIPSNTIGKNLGAVIPQEKIKIVSEGSLSSVGANVPAQTPMPTPYFAPTPVGTPPPVSVINPTPRATVSIDNDVGGQKTYGEDLLPTPTKPPIGGDVNGLPPAKGFQQTQQPFQQPTFQRPIQTPVAYVPPEPVQTPPPVITNDVPGLNETYNGRLGENRIINLNLVFKDRLISGSAQVSELGSFEVRGKVLERGLEIELNGEQGYLRLSSGSKSNKLRGRYSFPSRNENGAWDATAR